MSLACKGTYEVLFHVYIPRKLLNLSVWNYVRKSNLFANIIKMGKSMQHKEPPNMQLQNGNSGGVNKLFHALNRRHRWHNVRKGLPDKRKGSGKQVIDGETTEPAASTSQPPQVPGNRKKNKPQIEQSGAEASSVTSKSSKKFRIRSLIADRGKGQPRRRSPSPTRSPSKRSDSVKSSDRAKTPPKGSKSNCESPSTMKKRKCNICAAMLTVSYLRQKAQAYEHQKNLEIEQNRDKNQQPTSMVQVSNGRDTRYMHPRNGLKRSFSFPLLGSTKRKDFEIEELKRKLRDCKDKETTKEKFILPMNQWKDNLFPKPMLTRPASFKSPSLKTPSSSSQKENKQTPNQSKTLKQKIGRVMKESKECRESRENRKKEKRRILMDAVFHKIPYGRRNSKDPKKLTPDKIKSNSTTSSTGSHRMAADKASLKKTASTGEAMSKYRKLLSQTSIREEKSHLNDHKPRLCVAGDNSFGTNERTTLKRIHSSPCISPSDFTQDQEFPVKTQMNTHQSIASEILDDHKSLDHSAFAAKITVPTPAIQKLAKETRLLDKHETVDKNPGVGVSSSDHQEKINNPKESSEVIDTASKHTNLNDKDDAVDGNAKVGVVNTPDHQEKIDHKNESSSAIESEVKETKLVDNDEHVDENLVAGLNTSDIHENVNPQKDTSVATADETELVDKDEDVNKSPGVSLYTSDHENDIDQQKESSEAKETEVLVDKNEAVNENLDAERNSSDHEEENDNQEESTAANGTSEIDVDKDKSFNEIHGVFKTVERIKLDEGIEPLKVVTADTTVHKDDDADENLEVGQNTLDHQEKETSPLTSSEVERLMEDSALATPPVDTPQTPLEDFPDENQQYLFSIDDQPSTPGQPSIVDEPSTPDQPSIVDEPSTPDQPSIVDEPSTPDQPSFDDKRPNDHKTMNKNAASTVDEHPIRINGFLHLDLESVKDNTEFQFVKEVLERSGFLKNELFGEWYSSYQPIDPLLFEEIEASFLQTKNLEVLNSIKDDEAAQKIINDYHLHLFDLVNEALLEIHNKTCSLCPNALIYSSKVRPMPVGYRVLEEVWDIVNIYLNWRPDVDQASLDDAVTHDLEKGDGWMNLQADAEFVAIELEEMIADDLLDELVFDDLLM
ncbi:hypothetical protein L2E82_11455 [Cichorium intybus]|uniref:Uncharacterized protein n=1 Tax=Cichorium intybus TaxID=13427 RepID=A0ACB9GDD6_CICIN|nr:hypothetical protein L2E82_11455 [Cichorium intybus]